MSNKPKHGVNPSDSDRQDRLYVAPALPTDEPNAPAVDEPTLETLVRTQKRKHGQAVNGMPWLILGGLIVALAMWVMLQMGNLQRTNIALTQIAKMQGWTSLPPILPLNAVLQKELTTEFAMGSLQAFEWHRWTVAVEQGQPITVEVIERDETKTIPLIGIYDVDGKQVQIPQDESADQKVLTFTPTQNGFYTILVGNIGGDAGSYEIRRVAP